RLLQFCLGLDKSVRDVIGDSLQDWRDANEEHRLNGAESDDFYLKLPLPYRAHNANLESITELLQIHGVLETPAIFWGTEERPGHRHRPEAQQRDPSHHPDPRVVRPALSVGADRVQNPGIGGRFSDATSHTRGMGFEAMNFGKKVMKFGPLRLAVVLLGDRLS